MTPVDGDQPSLLIALASWAEVLGLEIIAAGKSSEYDFVLDAATGNVTCNGATHALPALREHWLPGSRSIVANAAERARILGEAFPLRAVPDLCEMTLVANALGFSADAAGFHAPPARIPEIADLFAERSAGRADAPARAASTCSTICACPRRRASPAASSSSCAATTPRPGRCWPARAMSSAAAAETAALYLPRHLLGVEVATSILDAAGLGRSGYGEDYRPRQDLVAVAQRDLAAGTALVMGGHHHSIDGVGAEIRPAAPLAAERPAPFYLVANRTLVRNVRAGDAIRLGDVEIPGDSGLLAMRHRQDALFATEAAAVV